MEDENTSLKSINDVHEEFETSLKHAYEVLINATIASNGLPKKTNYAYCQSFPKFKTFMDERGSEVLNMIENVYRSTNHPISMLSKNFKQHLANLHNVNEKLLEGVDKNLLKLSKNPNDIDPVIVATEKRLPNLNDSPSSSLSPRSSTVMRAILARNVVRPQNSFSDRIDNSVDTIWIPRIKDKPNSIKPLAIFLEETNDEIGQGYSHPYELELNQFKPLPDQLTKVTPKYPKPIEEVPLKMVTNTAELQDLYKDLLNHTEIAIDLEHHSYRSFQGVTCLMQISTPDVDYIVDTLSLRNELHLLNEIFTKPTVVKVLHGAVFDIQWLQRDLSLYIVNMFDTQIAAKHLNYPQLSLKALIYKFFKKEIDKTFQLADWRIRPLPEELINYAREDTHYLLYIYHMLRNELIQTGSLEMVIHQSTELCKQRYAKPKYTKETYLKTYHASRKVFNNRQLSALRQLYHWREMTARTEDESLGYVLPTHMMLQIAEILPREQQGILACCNPVPPLVRQNLLTLNKMIIKVRLEPLEKPILQSEPVTRQQIKQYGSLNWDTPLNCPHDLSKSDDEISTNLPTLLNNNTQLEKDQHISNTNLYSKQVPRVSVFDDVPIHTMDSVEKATFEKISFLCPYDRYKLMKEFAKDEKFNANEETQNEEDSQNENSNNNSLVIQQSQEEINEKLKEIRNATDDRIENNIQEAVPAPKLQDTSQTELSLNQMKRKRKHKKHENHSEKRIKTEDSISIESTALKQDQSGDVEDKSSDLILFSKYSVHEGDNNKSNKKQARSKKSKNKKR